MKVDNPHIAKRLRDALGKLGSVLKRYVEAERSAWRRRLTMKDRYGEARPPSWRTPPTP
jgi:hypothetical protein